MSNQQRTNHSGTLQYFVGVDLGGEQHAISVINSEGRVVGKHMFPHSGPGLEELVAWLRQQTGDDSSVVAVAMENPRGALCEALLGRNYTVYAINPKQLDRFRDRFSVAGAKDDARDAFVLAQSLRTDRSCFRLLHVDHPKLLHLRELSHGWDRTGQELRRTANQLNDLMRRYFPSLLTLCPGSDEPWLWSLLALAPLPEDAARIKRSRLEAVLKKHRIRRFSASELREVLRIPPLPLAPGSARAIAEQVVLLLPRLVLLQQQTQQLDKRIEALLDELAGDESYNEHRDVTILRSIPGVGKGFTAAVLSEAARPLADRDYRAIRGLAGIAPVTKQSGKTRLISMRQACNRRLRLALHHASASHARNDARAQLHYEKLRQKGHTHGRALRGVADRLLALLIAMLKAQTSYNPELRTVPS